jgi:hypothetical protein
VSESPYAHIDTALLYISEARERAEEAAKAMRELGAEERLVAAVEEADRELLALHRRLMEATYFPAPAETQLTLSA